MAQSKKNSGSKTTGGTKKHPNETRFTAFIRELVDSFRGESEISLSVKKVIVAFLSLVFFVSLLIVAWIEGGRKRVLEHPEAVVTGESKKCMNCHESLDPGIVLQWKESRHSHSGIGCNDCHKAEEGDPDLIEHYEGTRIATIVSPKDCSGCHEKQFEEFTNSHHAQGGAILGSLDNELAEIVEGHVTFDANGNKVVQSPAAVSGCLQCHGSEVKVLEGGKLSSDTWPNTGIGRLNPDGSRGACSACHMRHNFSVAQARQPENCGRCHMGPDHPHLEIYNESKHGIAFAANRSRLVEQMKERDWIPGKDFESGPTCSTCHMGKTLSLDSTHDVGARISWNLRPPISEKIDAAAKKKGIEVKSWEDRRSDMQDVCSNCHSQGWVDNWYEQYDNLITLYNEKFAIPATELYNAIRKSGMITSEVTFDDEIEFTYFRLWHHEGRRARHGASMMGPDYTQWHGMYEVAENFYTKFVPELREVIAHNKNLGGSRATSAQAVEAKLSQILNSPMHRWFRGSLSPAEKAMRAKARAEFQKRYAQ